MAGRGPGMRGRGGPPPNMGRGRSMQMPPEHMAYRDPAAMGMALRGRGAPQVMAHHPRPHPGQMNHHDYLPGAYPDMDSGGDITPESGSPDGTIDTYIPPGTMGGPNTHWDAILADNARLQQENAHLKEELNGLSEGNELSGPSWLNRQASPNPQLAQQLAQKDSEVQHLQGQLNQMFTSTTSEINTLKIKLKEATDRHSNETAKMKENINGLTEYIATSKAEDGVIDDEFFKAEFGKFAQSMRNWVWKHCRAATLSPDAVEDKMIREKIKWAVPDFSRLTISHSKIMVMQAVVNDIVLKRIFQRYCVGLSAEDEVSLGTMEQLMMRQAAGGGAITYNAINRWRALSVALLTAVDPIREFAESSIVDCTSDVESVVFSLIPPAKRPGDVASRQLIPLVATAVRLAHQLKSQRAKFEVISPMGHVFDPDWMEDASGMEDDADEDVRGKMVGAVAFPAVVKWGDEKGENYEKRTVIFRARVLCLLEGD